MTATDELGTLAIEVNLTKSDVFHSVLLTMVRRPYFWLAALMVGASVYLWLAPNSIRLFAAIAASLSVLFLVPYSTVRSTAKRREVFAPMTYVFSANGVAAVYQNGETRSAWSLVNGARENRDYIFIEMQRHTFYLVPKRFLSERQCAHLREMLRKHVSKNVRLPNRPITRI